MQSRFSWAVVVLASVLFLAAGQLGWAEETDKSEEGFVPIFDGKTLDGWDGDSEIWKVEEESISGTTTKENPLKANQFIIFKDEVDNFVLRLEFCIADEGVGNSGIQYRSKHHPEVGKWVVRGYQADIERTNQYMGILYEEGGRGILALPGEDVELSDGGKQVAKKVVGELGTREELFKDVKAGQWQKYEIVADGNHLIHKINGREIVNIVDNDTPRASQSGVLAFQVHVGEPMNVMFRNIRLKKLGDDK
ncbi:3-keto-disaccharide hydrolase [Aeoliella mucimassa]|uniref:3-keto-alpha-glucoside-1,2-lyase/3-keto-2-hydroxy-glucal hydratase domain-containing protein n=1 Tax=Aeoliella mucimassa TaxID=2527972 RepID=A0A518AK36_9BACT|nr:DUF1080 domain-containing protein [Aeoliella mucimassa]QDU55089.1 hypothetical protein Pan181_12750 [Aeoliella mucimassa]